MNNINDNQLNPYIQLSNAIFTFDEMENSAHAFGKHFTNVTDQPDRGNTLTHRLEFTLSMQNFELQTKHARETIKAIKLISPEAAADLKTRFQSIVEELNSNFCEKGLKGTQFREDLVQTKLDLMKNHEQSISSADQLEVQMLINDLSTVSEMSLNAFDSISQHRHVMNSDQPANLDPHLQLSNAILTLDRTENAADALDKFFTHVTEYQPNTGSKLTNGLELALANQNFEMEARQAKKTIKAIKLISPESAAELTTRYQSIVQRLYAKVSEDALNNAQFREALAKDRLAFMENRKDEISIADTFETQMLMNDLANISNISSKVIHSIAQQIA